MYLNANNSIIQNVKHIATRNDYFGNMIRLENLTKYYKNHRVLNNINLKIEKGEIVVILGSSGCGKSTMLKCINGLEKPTSGQVFIENVDIFAKPHNITKIREEVGIVFQQYNLFPHMTVKENIMLAPVKVKKMSKNDASMITLELLEKVGLLHKIDKYPDELSGGEMQRIAIARSLAMQPKIMLFDEPTSALDPKMTQDVLDVIKSLAQDGMTMVVVTHEMAFARELATRVVFLHKSEIAEENTPVAFFANPQKRVTQDFLKNVFK